ncbi:MAG: hypothetical protein IJW03_03160 [Clostridia bacterium]|nr:hypothetical protein [Clostridia bacterium]
MKKVLSLLLALIMVLSLASCTLTFGDFDSSITDEQTPPDNDPSKLPEKPEEQEKVYKYTDFTPAEKKIFADYIGETVPFISNDEYYVEGYYEDTDYENGINFYTVGNTEAEFAAYRESLTGYTLTKTYKDEDTDTWYSYTKGNITLELSYYLYDGNYCVDIYVSVKKTAGEDNKTYTYTDFTSEQKQLFTQYIGAIIPFIPNNEYYVEGYYDTIGYEYGMRLWTVGNTEAEFNAYLEKYSSYVFDGTYVDEEYGDTWYCYIDGDVVVDLTYYTYEGESYVEVYVYSDLSLDPEDTGNTGTGGGTGGTESSDVEIITNKNKGLPPDADGVYDVDFTVATNVKDVTDQGYYLEGCPTTGSPAVLVIPVQFSDAKASTLGYSVSVIKNAFEKDGEVDYYSVYDYYFISSYEKLTLDITVLDSWFTPKNSSSYYENLTDSEGYAIGDQAILDEALAYLEPTMDLSKFDSDGNDIIDAVVLINTLDIGEDDFHWAYRYWNYYTDDEGYYYEYDGVSANDYLWASYQFIYESYDADGNVSYDDTTVRNTYTYIHEFGHILGADDYYDTAYEGAPMDGYDIMDAMTGDHNAYTKFNYGWLTTSRLVVAEDSITLTLEDFSKNGDTIIIANNFDVTLGVYQEYYIVVYYTNNSLNAGDDYGYFSRDGVVVYHVNASLYKEVYEGETYYDVYNSNTDASDENYGTVDNLIEFVKSSAGNFTYVAGDTLPTVTDDNGAVLAYSFTVDSLTSEAATITFTKR